MQDDAEVGLHALLHEPGELTDLVGGGVAGVGDGQGVLARDRGAGAGQPEPAVDAGVLDQPGGAELHRAQNLDARHRPHTGVLVERDHPVGQLDLGLLPARGVVGQGTGEGLGDDRVGEERPGAVRVGVVGVEHHALAGSQPEHALAQLGQRHPVAQLHPESVGQLRVGYRLAQGVAEHGGLLRHVAQLEFDREHHTAAALLEHRGAVTQAELRGAEPFHLTGLEVEEVDGGEAAGQFLAVCADVLHRGRTAGPRDAGERLDAGPAVGHREGDEVVPRFAGLHADAHRPPVDGPFGIRVGAGLVRRSKHLDTPGAHADDRAVEAGVGRDGVRATAEQHPRFVGAPGVEGGLDQAGLIGRRNQVCGGAADTQRRQLGQGHGRRNRRGYGVGHVSARPVRRAPAPCRER